MNYKIPYKFIILSCFIYIVTACTPDKPPPVPTLVDANWNPRDAGFADLNVHDSALPPDAAADAATDAATDAAWPDADQPDIDQDAAVTDLHQADVETSDAELSDHIVTDIISNDAFVNDATQFADAGVDAGSVAGMDAGIDPAANPCFAHFAYAPSDTPAQILLAGSFNNWAGSLAEGAWAMRDDDGDGLWSLDRELDGGRYQYKFIVDGQWLYDPEQPSISDANNNINNLLLHAGCAAQCKQDFNWHDAVMYFAMVDRFANADGQNDPVVGATEGDASSGPSAQYEGGDLAGLTQKMPYLADLGVTALWLSAPYENRNSVGGSINSGDTHLFSAYHGYWPSPQATDFSQNTPSPLPQVESRIGDDEDLLNLVAQAHAASSANQHGIKVLFDYVMNHVDDESPLYQNHSEWFVPPWDGQGTAPPGVTTAGELVLCQPGNLWEDPYWGTRCAFTSYLPAFDYSKAEARAWSVNDALWWAQTYNIDGYRLDAIKHVPLNWLTDLRNALNSDIDQPAGGRFYLVGETFDYYNPDKLKAFVDPQTMLDGQFDFPFKRKACEALFSYDIDMQDLANWMDDQAGYYGQNAIMTTWIGNHDVPRAVHFASGQISNCSEGSYTANSWDPQSYAQPSEAFPYQRMALAYALMMSKPGIPLIYYGDEIGLAGGGDPDNRRLMPWDDTGLNQAQKDLRSKIKKLAHLRAQWPVLGRGFSQTLSDSTDTWVYKMSGCGQENEIIIAINRSWESRDVLLPSGVFTNLVDDSSISGGSFNMTPYSYVLLKAQD